MTFSQEKNNEFILAIVAIFGVAAVLCSVLFFDFLETRAKQATIQACLNHNGTIAECAKLGQ